MPQYLRSVRRGRWELPQWLSPSRGDHQADALCDLQADALGDLATRGNKLSVFRVESDQDIDRITVALAATRDNLQNVDYAVFDDAELQGIGIHIRQSPGKTPAYQVNELHYDFFQLTARQTADLAAIIAKGNIARRPRFEIKESMRLAIQGGELDQEAIKKSVLSQLS